MSKRDQLALILCREENGEDACKESCIHPENNSFCPYGFVVDKLLDELLEPGEAALGMATGHPPTDFDADLQRTEDLITWQAIIRAIRAGK